MAAASAVAMSCISPSCSPPSPVLQHSSSHRIAAAAARRRTLLCRKAGISQRRHGSSAASSPWLQGGSSSGSAGIGSAARSGAAGSVLLQTPRASAWIHGSGTRASAGTVGKEEDDEDDEDDGAEVAEDGDGDAIAGADPAAAAAADYDWEKEWYPLYLTRELPRHAPLALQVFHRRIVLHFDGHGVLRCYEDRCPHRCKPSLPFPSLPSELPSCLPALLIAAIGTRRSASRIDPSRSPRDDSHRASIVAIGAIGDRFAPRIVAFSAR
jgi:hypothetical protein